MHPANNMTYVIANDDGFDQETKWQLGLALCTVSKQEDQSCLVGQQGYGVMWTAYSLIFGLKWEP
jgi:hypothetical protein